MFDGDLMGGGTLKDPFFIYFNGYAAIVCIERLYCRSFTYTMRGLGHIQLAAVLMVKVVDTFCFICLHIVYINRLIKT